MGTESRQISEILRKAAALHREDLIEAQQRLLDSGLTKFPDSPELHQERAISLFGFDAKAAKKHARKCIELAPEDPDKLAICGDLLFNLGEIKEAFACAGRALALVGNDSPLMALLSHLMGKIAKEKGLYEDAERYLKFAFSEDPDMQTWGHELAALYYETGRFGEALSVVDQALEHRPESQGLQSLRLEIISAMGRN